MEHDEVICLSFSAEDAEKNEIFQSSIVTLQDKCQWDVRFVLKHASHSENKYFRFKFFQHWKGARIFWFHKDIECTSLACGSEGYSVIGYNSPKLKRKTFHTKGTVQEWAFDMAISIQVAYNAQIKYLEMTIANYEVSSVKINIDNFDQIHPVRQRDRHKVVCVLQFNDRKEQNIKRDYIYLGRPQGISTNPDGRTYTWKLSKDAAAFPGLSTKRPEYWANHKEQHNDMLKLSFFNQSLSARHKRHSDNFVPDNDDYSNPLIFSSPVHITSAQDVTLRFYNLAIGESAMIELHLRRADFSTSVERPKRFMRKQAKKPTNQRLMCEIHDAIWLSIDYCEEEEEERVCLLSIQLSAKNYLETLNFDKLKFSRMKSI